jgi:trimeric autotransporter adhesin
VVGGLTAGIAYRCWARTVTNLGTSIWSAASNWATPTNGKPAVPVMGTATAGGGQVSVTFTPGSLNGGTLTHHHVTCTASSGPAYNGYGSASPIVVGGLTSGVAYRCWARTVTNLGTSIWSAASNWATPTDGTPAVPVMGTATAGGGQVSVSFTPGSLNGGTLTHHHVTCTTSSGGSVYNGYGSASPIVVSGLTAGVAYRCWARTVTNLGTSIWSGASNWATPS